MSPTAPRDATEVLGRGGRRSPTRGAITRLTSRLDSHMLDLVHGAAVAFSVKILAAGLQFALNVVIGRSIGTTGAGLYFLTVTMATVFSVFGRFGVDNTIVRFTSANAAVENWIGVRGVYGRAMALAAAGSAASAAALFVLAPVLAEILFSKPHLTLPFRWIAAAVLPFSLGLLHAEALKGIRRIFASQLIQGVSVPGFTLLAFVTLGRAFGVSGAVLSYVAASLFSMACGVALWRRFTPALRSVTGRFPVDELLRSSVPLYWVSLMNLALNWTSMFTLGIWGTSADVGVFGAASRTAMLTSFVLIAVNTISGPKFSALYQKRDMAALARTARGSARLMTVLAGPPLLVFALFPQSVLGLYGPEFRQGALALVILALGQFVNVATGSVNRLLMMTGNEKAIRTCTALAMVANVGLNLTLTPLIGVPGASIATAVGLTVQNIVAMFMVNRLVGVRMFPLLPPARGRAA